jgi:Zn-dependent protease
MFLQISSGQEIILAVIAIVSSLVLHEAMHGYVAYWLGDTTASEHGRLTLNPLKSIDPIYTVILPIISIIIFKFPLLMAKPVPVNFSRLKFDEYGMALVGITGPATNFVLAIIGAVLFRSVGVHSSALVYNFLLIFVEINIFVMLINLIPIPPLDGSRVLYAFAPAALRELMENMESYGIYIAFVVLIAIYTVPAAYDGLANLADHLLTTLLG